MFEVGDKVKIKSPYSSDDGKVGIIETILPDIKEIFIYGIDFRNDGPYCYDEVQKVVESDNYLENFRAAIREELSKWRDPKQIGGGHYTDMVIEPLDVAYLNDLNTSRTSVLKYVMRNKNGIEDLKKAKNLVEKIALYEFGEDI